MNIFLSIKYHSDGSNCERISKIKQLLSAHKMTPYCVACGDEARFGSAEELMLAALLLVRECKLVVIDLTEKGVGVGVEAGYAYARGIPIITISQGGFEVSESVVGISREVFYYRDWNDLDWFLGRVERLYVPREDASLALGSI